MAFASPMRRPGCGPPLIKAANWLSHLEFDVGSPVWSHLLIELSRQHTLIRYDERGCGLSDREVADLSFDAWLHDLETVVEAAQVEPLSVARNFAGRIDRGRLRGSPPASASRT